MINSLVTLTSLEQSTLTKFNQEEQKIILASKNAKRFKDFENEDKKELAKLFLKLSYFVGIKEPLSIDSLKLLVKFTISEYPFFNSEELEQSFYFACSGKLGDLEHFQNFSPIYVGKVINLYTQYTSGLKIKFQREQEQVMNQIEREKKNETYNVLEGATQSLLAEYENYLKTAKYDEESDNYNPYVEIMAQTCVMLLNKSLNFFNEMGINGSSHIELLSNYFLTLPTELHEANNQIKHDCNVCYQRKNNQPDQV
jgi:hypothetical protein